MTNEVRIKDFTVTVQFGKIVQVLLEEIRSRSHSSENDKIIETPRHIELANQIGAAAVFQPTRVFVFDREITHKIGLHSLVLQVPQELAKSCQV